MKYIIRALKYFIYITVLVSVMLFLLSYFNVIGDSIDDIFRNGTQSVKQIAIVLAIFSIIYPSFGYGCRNAVLPGSYDEIRPGVMDVMEERGYRLVSEKGQDLVFVRRSPVMRFLRMYEDTLTFTRNISGFEIEGPVKDSVRIISALEYRARQ